MNINITGHHIDVGQSLQDYVRQKLPIMVKKHFKHPLSAKVIFEKEAKHAIVKAEILIHEAAHNYAFADAEEHDAYKAFDSAMHKAEVQLVKYKEKNSDH
jgi:putative sigma-54 modulation protein